ncbi:MAG: PfkB family carbohydrate kinase [Oscillospiraceae bacterium]|nr:PfkB family carbohydrate kinase [Oscillospiraceae bacterium]
MIYTLTMNPALDYITTVPELKRGAVNRSGSGEFRAAGKGVNVSLALKRLGVESVAVCVCGQGFLTDEFTRLIHEQELTSVQITSAGCDIRLNVKLNQNDSVTEINGLFFVNEHTVSFVWAHLSELKQGDILAVCGSLPNGVPAGFYAEITAKLSERGVKVIVDTSGEPLREVVKSGKAWMITPNRHELDELEKSGVKIKPGNPNVLATFGEEGVTLTTSEFVHSLRPKKILNGYTVGAGDNLLAGLIAEFIESQDYKKALFAGVDCAENYIENQS